MGTRQEGQTSDQEETVEVSRSLNGRTDAELHVEGRGGTQVLKKRASQEDFLKSQLYIILYLHHNNGAITEQ